MKRKIYTISLLLSFLVILSHEMIPHHHHHDFDLDEFSSFHNHDEQYSHHKTDDHHHHDVDNQKHNHTFPSHHHISTTNDFDYLRIKLIRNIVFHFPLSTVLNSFFDISLSEPPELDFIRFTDKPFFITTIFEPGAVGLRAPPSIA